MKKKKKEGATNTAEAGIRVLTVALFIILLAFFIVLNAMGVDDEKNILAALGSLTGSFGILPGGISPSEESEIRLVSSNGIPVDQRDSEAVEVTGTGKFGRGVVDVRSTPFGQIVSIRNKVFFDEDSYRIKPEAYEFLKDLCKIINMDLYPVEITGHTDDTPLDPETKYSHHEISSLRAMEVFKFFVVIGKVLPTRIVAYGCGKERPIASNKTRLTRAQNRRVDILLTKTDKNRIKDFYKKDQTAFAVFKRFVFRVFD